MKQSLITTLLAFVAGSLAQYLTTDAPCQNGPTTRRCWGQYDINTNYYDVFPVTNKVREYWLSVIEVPCAPDGYQRTCQTFNGTVPGPAITADWGDELIIHVTNNLKNNGTSIHCHGLRQLNNVQYDGVPGVTQCPIAPGQTFTYKIPVTQYGSTWYHSHLSLQYANGLFGPLILNGPATANYDEDLGAVFLQDWSHTDIFTLWHTARLGSPTGTPLENGLINGMNTYHCPASTNYKCLGNGKKWEATIEPRKKYRLRLINIAIEGHF